MISQACRKCGVVLNGSKKWVDKKLAQPCRDHKGNGKVLWQ